MFFKVALEEISNKAFYLLNLNNKHGRHMLPGQKKKRGMMVFINIFITCC